MPDAALRELPFAIPIARGAFATGQFDLAYRRLVGRIIGDAQRTVKCIVTSCP